MAKKPHKALKRPGGYFQKHREILESPAYRDLGCVARCLLDEFQRVYTPSRNGFLSISTRKAASLLKVAENTASKAFLELKAHGFIEQTSCHIWPERKAREWRLTFEACQGREPTDDWRKWVPKSKDKKVRSQNVGQDCFKSGGSLPQSTGQDGSEQRFCHQSPTKIQ